MPAVGLDFEYCAVQQLEKKTFVLHNTSSSMVQFEVQNDNKQEGNFVISPRNGTLRLHFPLNFYI